MDFEKMIICLILQGGVRTVFKLLDSESQVTRLQVSKEAFILAVK